MNITVKPEIQKRIEEKIRAGEFQSADDMVEQALTFFWEFEEENADQEEFAEIKAAIDEALDQVDQNQDISIEDFEREMREKHGISR